MINDALFRCPIFISWINIVQEMFVSDLANIHYSFCFAYDFWSRESMRYSIWNMFVGSQIHMNRKAKRLPLGYPLYQEILLNFMHKKVSHQHGWTKISVGEFFVRDEKVCKCSMRCSAPKQQSRFLSSQNVVALIEGRADFWHCFLHLALQSKIELMVVDEAPD